MRAMIVIVCLAGLSIAVRTQQLPSQPPPTFQSGVDIVQVDVSVLDNDRRPVQGLTIADFTVLEDGKPRPIVGFVPVQLAERERASAAAWLRDVTPDITTNDVKREGRLVIIMFDWSIRFDDSTLARRIATAAVDQLGPGDLAAVVFTSAFANAGTPQNFTADRARLLAAINRPFAFAMHDPCGIHADPRNENCVMIQDPEGYESGDCYCRLCVPETIARVADAVRDVQGRRKTLLFIGTYFRSYEGPQGPASLLAALAKKGRRASPLGAGVCAGRVEDATAKMVRATSLANLTIHTMDAVGLETPFNSPLGGSVIGQTERREDLAVLADLTGGRAVMNTNAPEEHVPAVFAESHSYYLLAFAPVDPKKNGKLHKIEVKVDRRAVMVRTRAGYYAGPTREPGRREPSTVSSEAATTLDGVLPGTDVPLSVSVAPFATPGRSESAVAIVLGVGQQVPADRAAANGTVKVLAAAFDRNGRSVQSEDQTVGITRRVGVAGRSAYEVISRLALKPGRYEVRVGLDDGPGQRASVYTFVDVPDFANQPLSLSGIVLAASPAVPSAPRDAFTNLLPIVPTAQREFAPTDRATAFLQVYQDRSGTPQPVTVTAQIADTSDRVVLDETTSLSDDRFTGNRSADYRFELPVDRLERGEYLLTIEASQRQHVARRGVRFTVR